MAQNLPTPTEMFRRAGSQLRDAYRVLGDAGDELRSDWPPGYVLGGDQADAKSEIYKAIGEAKAAIDRAQDAVYRAVESGDHRESRRG